MKKVVLVTLVVLLSLGQLFATHVDVNTAKSIGEKYVRNNMQSLRGFQNSKHVLTISDDNGNACLYIFNIEDKGYYIVSADDRAKPILAYSEEGSIDINKFALTFENFEDADSFSVLLSVSFSVLASVSEEVGAEVSVTFPSPPQAANAPQSITRAKIREIKDRLFFFILGFLS